MKNEAKAKEIPVDRRIEDALAKQLTAIEQEETPERLLVLARELQRLLREKGH